MAIGPRKFYKINGLDGVFQYDYNSSLRANLYDVAVARGFVPGFLQADNNYFGERINEHTILFITACKADEGRYVKFTTKDTAPENIKTYYKKLEHGDTMIWARGDLYAVSTKAVTNVYLDQLTKAIVIEYSDGTQSTISEDSMSFSAEFPIQIRTTRGYSTIYLSDIKYDSKHNLRLNEMENAFGEDVNNTFVVGKGNQSSVDFQHIEGQYAEINGRYIFAIGNGTGTTNRLNLFEVDFDGTVITKRDFIAEIDEENPIHREDLRADHKEYKLSDIHHVLEVDWWFMGDLYADYIDRDYNDDFNT